MKKYISSLEKALLLGLPGTEAQYKMAHTLRLDYTEKPNSYKEAATLLLLYPKDEQWYFVLEERTSKYKGDKHAGQISFPGGSIESTDISRAMAAQRETEEEVGIVSRDVKILGALTPLYIPVSQFKVYPFVGTIDYTPSFVLEKEEVKSILEIPVAHLLSPKNKKSKALQLSPHIVLNDVPYYDFNNHVVWGATAMMLSEFETIHEAFDYKGHLT